MHTEQVMVMVAVAGVVIGLVLRSIILKIKNLMTRSAKCKGQVTVPIDGIGVRKPVLKRRQGKPAGGTRTENHKSRGKGKPGKRSSGRKAVTNAQAPADQKRRGRPVKAEPQVVKRSVDQVTTDPAKEVGSVISNSTAPTPIDSVGHELTVMAHRQAIIDRLVNLPPAELQVLASLVDIDAESLSASR